MKIRYFKYRVRRPQRPGHIFTKHPVISVPLVTMRNVIDVERWFSGT